MGSVRKDGRTAVLDSGWGLLCRAPLGHVVSGSVRSRLSGMKRPWVGGKCNVTMTTKVLAVFGG